jgi:predicted Zn finger-like uncharacterized protein
MSTIIDCPSCSRKLRVPDELAGQTVKCPTCNETFALIEEPAVESPAPPASSDAVPANKSDQQPGLPQNPSPDAPRPSEETAPVETKEEKDREPAGSGHAGVHDPRRALPPGEDLMPCPYCGEPIAKDAARCRYCGENLGEEEEEDRPWEREFRPYRGARRDSEPHRGTLILTLGIVSIVIGLFWFISFIGLGLGITAWIMGYRDMKKMRANQMDPQGYGTTQAGLICGIVGTSLSSLCSLGCVAYLAFIGYFMVGASRMTPMPAPSPTPIPKKAPAKPGKGNPGQIQLQHYLPTMLTR